MLALYRPSNRLDAPSDARHERGAAKPRANVVTFGADDDNNGAPVPPSAQVVGTLVGSDRYCAQFGVGTAAPTQVSWISPEDRPVAC